MKKFISIFPYFELQMIAIVFMTIYGMVLFVFPISNAILLPETFGSGVITYSGRLNVTITNDSGVSVLAYSPFPSYVGERWSVRVENSNYVLDRKCK